MKERSKVHLCTLGQQVGIESVSVHLQYTKLVTVWGFFYPLFHKMEKKKDLFHDFFIWKDIYCGSHVQMGIDLHRKTSGTPENTIHDLTKIKEN